MHVIRAVARYAGRLHRFFIRRRPDVAALARKPVVRAIEHEIGLAIVVEAPKRPAGGVVAGAASATERLSVCVVLFVAVDTGRRCVPIGRRQMTLFAGHDAVHADEGNAAQVVIEAHRVAPAGLAVTGLAPSAQLLAVRVVRCVAAMAVTRNRVVQTRSSVTRLAWNLGVTRA